MIRVTLQQGDRIIRLKLFADVVKEARGLTQRVWSAAQTKIPSDDVLLLMVTFVERILSPLSFVVVTNPVCLELLSSYK